MLHRRRNQGTFVKNKYLSGIFQIRVLFRPDFEHLLESMTALKAAQSPDEREPLFEKSLTSIYFLQKCLDFEAGGDLAKNLFRVYEFSRQAVLDFVLREKGHDNMDKSIEYVTLIVDGWNGIENSV